MEVYSPVILNVYDLYWTNKYTKNVGIGFFHSGIEVFGVEYGYCGHRFAFSGIFGISPRDPSQIGLGESVKFRESIHLGYTKYTSEEVCHLIGQLDDRFTGDLYHLIHKNCNHFSDSLAVLLCGTGIPPWVNRLARMGSFLPLIEQWVPKNWLMPHDEGRNRDENLQHFR